jgi:hypothetical protein
VALRAAPPEAAEPGHAPAGAFTRGDEHDREQGGQQDQRQDHGHEDPDDRLVHLRVDADGDAALGEVSHELRGGGVRGRVRRVALLPRGVDADHDGVLVQQRRPVEVAGQRGRPDLVEADLGARRVGREEPEPEGSEREQDHHGEHGRQQRGALRRALGGV